MAELTSDHAAYLPDPPPGYRVRKGDPETVLLLAAGKTWVETAHLSGVSYRTISRRMADPAYRAWVADTRRAMLEGVVARLAGLLTEAVDVLADIMRHGRATQHRLTAARALLAEYRALGDYADIESRLARLEAALDRQSAPLGAGDDNGRYYVRQA